MCHIVKSLWVIFGWKQTLHQPVHKEVTQLDEKTTKLDEKSAKVGERTTQSYCCPSPSTADTGDTVSIGSSTAISFIHLFQFPSVCHSSAPPLALTLDHFHMWIFQIWSPMKTHIWEEILSWKSAKFLLFYLSAPARVKHAGESWVSFFSFAPSISPKG